MSIVSHRFIVMMANVHVRTVQGTIELLGKLTKTLIILHKIN